MGFMDYDPRVHEIEAKIIGFNDFGFKLTEEIAVNSNYHKDVILISDCSKLLSNSSAYTKILVKNDGVLDIQENGTSTEFDSLFNWTKIILLAFSKDDNKNQGIIKAFASKAKQMKIIVVGVYHSQDDEQYSDSEIAKDLLKKYNQLIDTLIIAPKKGGNLEGSLSATILYLQSMYDFLTRKDRALHLDFYDLNMVLKKTDYPSYAKIWLTYERWDNKLKKYDINFDERFLSNETNKKEYSIIVDVKVSQVSPLEEFGSICSSIDGLSVYRGTVVSEFSIENEHDDAVKVMIVLAGIEIDDLFE